MSEATHEGSIVIGQHLKSNVLGGVVLGFYNDPNAGVVAGQANTESGSGTGTGTGGTTTTKDALLTIGNGSSHTNRQNIFQVYSDGTAYIKTTDGSNEAAIVNKQHLNAVINPIKEEFQTQLSGKLGTSGGTMTGPLYIADDSVARIESYNSNHVITRGYLDSKDFATKAYVDSKAGSGTGTSNIANLKDGTGTGSLQQVQDGTTGKFSFTGKNATATALDSTLTGDINYGGTGAFATAFGGKAAAIGKRSFAHGTTTIAKGNYSHAEGDNSVALGSDSHAEGYETTTNGMAAHSEGFKTLANAHSSHSEGFETKTFGDSSHAEGAYSQTLKQYVVAKSENTTPEVEQATFNLMATNLSNNCGYAAHAEGSSKALGYLAHSQGSSNAYGHYSFASGIGCQTGSLNLISETDTEKVYTSSEVGRGAHAFGVGAYAQYNGQTAVGMFNDNKDTTLFEVGNGVSHGHRSNALEVHSDGLVVIPNGAKGIKIGDTVLTQEKLNKLLALIEAMEA